MFSSYFVSYYRLDRLDKVLPILAMKGSKTLMIKKRSHHETAKLSIKCIMFYLKSAKLTKELRCLGLEWQKLMKIDVIYLSLPWLQIDLNWFSRHLLSVKNFRNLNFWWNRNHRQN